MSQDKASGPEQKSEISSSGARLFSGRRSLRSPSEALQPETAPPPPGPPPSHRRPTLSAVSGFLSFLLVLAVCAMAGVGYLQQQLSAPGPLASDKVVIIARGADTTDIVAQLESEGVIDNSTMLNAALLAEGNRSKVRAGEFLFKKNASLREVIDTLVSGREILHSVTIPEGLTSEQVIQRLKDNDLLSGEVREIPKEGTLLPDTYRVSRGLSRSNLIRTMQDEQKRALDRIWAQRSPELPVRSPFELVTLASIVEKETGRADERPRVAGVFVNRLVKRMRLQSDPTIVYGLVGGKGTLGRGILRSEVTRPTPYNTYTIDGLPPGPIANPGRAAMEAVAHPSRTKDLFFVADGTGGHAFAETLDQHSRNVTRWRQLEKDVKERQQAPIDRAAPDEAPAVGQAPRDQRGEIDLPADALPGGGVFGALPLLFGRSSPAAEGVSSENTQIALLPKAARPNIAEPPAPPLSSVRPAKAEAVAPPLPGRAPLTQFSLGAQLDQKVIAGFMPPESPTDLADDFVVDNGSASETVVPLSAQRRADLKARAARFGLSGIDDSLPVLAFAPQARGQDVAVVPSVGQPIPKIIKIYDASEGTALDPLRDRSWDLNSPKTVPSFQPEPRVADRSAARQKPAPKPVRSAAPRPAPAQ